MSLHRCGSDHTGQPDAETRCDELAALLAGLHAHAADLDNR